MKTLEQFIKKEKFYYSNALLTSANFPRPKVVKTTGGKMFEFGKPVSSQEAIDLMKKEGYRPANTYELLEWLKENRELVKSNPWKWYVALGQTFTDADGDHRVPYVKAYSDGVFSFHLGHFERVWDSGQYLLWVLRRECSVP